MAKTAAYGSKLAVQYAQTGSYLDIASVGDFSGPEISVETIDVTTHDSANNFNEFLAGMADGGEVSFDLIFDPSLAAHETLYNAVSGRLKHNFYVKFPGWVSTAAGGYLAFAGIFTKVGLSFPVKDKVGASVTLKVSGKPVYTKFV
jgi:hypothetical protein